VRLVAIGLVAGLFSALFGVGGGLVIVPMLVYWLRYDLRSATGTSLVAIGITALAGTVAYALHGELKTGAALIVGVPAAFGAYTGAALQQRLAMRTLTLAFAALVIAIGIRLLL
jgi:hypothetical protein